MSLATVPNIENLSDKVKSELHDILDTRQMPLYNIMAYHLGWEDHLGNTQHPMTRIHEYGAACLLSCYATGGDIGAALPAAASVELVNSSHQVHNDIEGGRPKRHGRDSVWWIWGPAQAINAGDGLHALARIALFRLQERGSSAPDTFQALRILDESILQICEGRFQDLEAQERMDLSIAAYIEMAAKKSGALYSCALRLGALVSHADNTTIESMGLCGTSIGIAVQIREDLLDVWERENSQEDSGLEVLNKKKLLPIVYALEHATGAAKRSLGELYFKRVLEPNDLEAIRQGLEKIGAREYCKEQIQLYCAEARLAASKLTIDGSKAMTELIDSILS